MKQMTYEDKENLKYKGTLKSEITYILCKKNSMYHKKKLGNICSLKNVQFEIQLWSCSYMLKQAQSVQMKQNQKLFQCLDLTNAVTNGVSYD